MKEQHHNHHTLHKITFGGLLLTFGIVFGDIGTSPLYVFRAIIGADVISRDLVLGGLSCIFWTLTIQTTFKYVLLTLRADNKGEGGIFALYTLIRRRRKWLVLPAIIGGSALLADGIITPSISVTSAVEGLEIYNPDLPIVLIVISILLVLFIFQRFGTKVVGNAFGPVMVLWFLMLAVLGVSQIAGHAEVFSALNPRYAYHLLFLYPGGFWLLGAVFLCTTGAEALYSDLGHCGRKNIQISWVFIKICLLLNYFGQGAWLLANEGSVLSDRNPFYYIMPSWFLIPGIIIATAAAVIASQALISGSYTLISEAMRLNLWPKVTIHYPTVLKGQLYIPSINWLLCVGCIGIVLFFKGSTGMEAAYGLAITITMLMTTVMLSHYLIIKRVPVIITYLAVSVFLTIELAFLVANLSKFSHGGWVTVTIGTILAAVMWIWFKARKIKNRYTEFVRLDKYLPMLKELSEDESVPKYATHLVYLTSGDYRNEIESKVMYSIFNKQPKRADTYCFIHVHLVDEPHTKEYKVDVLVPNKVNRIEFRLGFRVEPRINLFFRKAVEEMVKNKEIDITSRYKSLCKNHIPGDFRFVLTERVLTYDYDLSAYEQLIMDAYHVINRFSLSEEKAFELDTSVITVEKVPLIVSTIKEKELKRIVEEKIM